MEKRVFITGITRGIGRGIAEKFLENGYFVYGTFNSHKEEADDLSEKYPGRVFTFGPHDFTDTDNAEKLLEEIKNKGIVFDSVVSSAGMFCFDYDTDDDLDEFNNFKLDRFKKIMNCNFYTPLILLLGLKGNIVEGGSIVIIASNDAYPGAFSSLSYSISKSALISLMKCLSMGYGKHNVRVNSVSPGAIDTAMNTPEQMDLAPYFSSINRVGTPADVAENVFFLATSAPFVTGMDYTVDAGYKNMSLLLKAENDSALSHVLRGFIKNPKAVEKFAKQFLPVESEE